MSFELLLRLWQMFAIFAIDTKYANFAKIFVIFATIQFEYLPNPCRIFVRFAIFARFSISVRFAFFVNFSTLQGAPLVI